MNRLMMVTLIGVFVLGLTGTALADPVNLALGVGHGGVATATQSSNYSSGSVAGLAIDGNTDGNYFHYSVSHTGYDQNAWWRVDLQNTYSLGQIVIWNRTDNGNGDRLTNFYVKVLDEGRSTVWTDSFYTSGLSYPALKEVIDLPLNVSGRFVEIGFNTPDHREPWLQLAEVQVYGSTAVPLPGALLLLGPGLVGLAAIRRRFTK